VQLLIQFFVPLSKKYGAKHLVQVILFKHEIQLVILLESSKLHKTHLLFALSVHTDGSFFFCEKNIY